MNAEQDRAKSIFLNAAEIASAAEREAFVLSQCGQEEGLRREVAELLRHHGQAGGFLESPVANLPSPLREGSAGRSSQPSMSRAPPNSPAQ